MGQRRRFTPEFKRQALQLLSARQRPAAEIARELGIPRNRLYKWQKPMAVHGGEFPGSGRQAEPEALAMAVRQRRMPPGLIRHSDRGAQYSCTAYQRQLSTLGITPSMSRKGNCYDNAVAESFFSTVKNELVHHDTYQTRDEASREVFAFIEGFYNRQRLHQSLGYVSPLEFERRLNGS